MEQNHIESLYLWLDELVQLLDEDIDAPYLERMTMAGEMIFQDSPPEDVNDLVKQKLHNKLNEITLDNYSKEEIRKGIQLAILKGMKEGTQQHHLMTPDTVAMFIGYLVSKLQRSTERLRLFDPVCGSANLLTAVINHLKEDVEAYGSEVDPTLIQLAYINSNLQKTPIEFFHQDSLAPFLLKPVDMVIADLPVGYYPDDAQANSYKLKAEEGHSYAHHLLMEQSITYTSPGGYLLFLIPNFLFESDQSDQLHAFLQEHVHILGVLQLPKSMFSNEKFGKSIFIIQKKGENTKVPSEALLAQLPSFKDAKAMNNMLDQVNQWFAKELGV